MSRNSLPKKTLSITVSGLVCFCVFFFFFFFLLLFCFFIVAISVSFAC